jgi:hypothetical protein
MSLFYAYLSFDTSSKIRWSEQNEFTVFIKTLFDILMISHHNLMSSTTFDIVRDQLRDKLSEKDSVHFPRFGTVGAPIELIFEYLLNPENIKLSICYRCSSSIQCNTVSTTTIDDYIPTILYNTLWSTWCEQSNNNPCHPQSATTQDWIDLAFLAKSLTHSPVSHNTNCTAPSIIQHVYIKDPSPLLTIEVQPSLDPIFLSSKTLIIKTLNSHVEYNLRAIVYHGNFHFTSRLFDPQNGVWIYDDQKNNGFPILEKTSTDPFHPHDMRAIDNRLAHLYIYGL